MGQQTKSLAALGLAAQSGRDAQITGLTVDSRNVRDGMLFAALPGAVVHGAEFIQYALRMGASAILTDPKGAEIAAIELAASDAALIIAQDPRQTLALTASLWSGAHPRTVVAVTGTNGKTSVSTFARQIWEEMGIAGVNLGTTGVEGAWTHPLKHTTPEPITLHRVMAEATAQGITHVAMEASSHGLDQRRLDGVVLAAAGFTNFTQDHLDYHATFDAYFAAKAGLFDRVLGPQGIAVINVDDAKAADLLKGCAARGQSTITVGRGEADFQILGQKYDSTGQDILFSWQGENHQVRVPLVGGFQGENLMLAAAMVLAAGGEAEEVFASLKAVRSVRGRMELAATRSNGASDYVD
jgi:UDP-N-acetylmuramoyl-L-alanyl-D-glutamate--2,6-diaminopimelate ligase